MKKHHLWLLSIPIIAVAALFQLTFDLGEQGRLSNKFLREDIYPIAKSVNGTMTNVKFRLRGPEPVKNKIVILEADDASIEALGRWPWYRDVYAEILYTLFSKFNVKSVGIDITFSEPEKRVPDEVYELIKTNAPQIMENVKAFEGDPALAQVISKYKDKIVLGQSMNLGLQPLYTTNPEEVEAIHSEELSKGIEEQMGKFALKQTIPLSKEVIWKSPMMYMLTILANVPVLRDAAQYAGLFSVEPDPDGYIRRYPLFAINNNKMYPSLALQMAELAKEDETQVHFTDDGRVAGLNFKKTPEVPVPVTNLGFLDLNFRGKARTFPYVSVFEMIKASGEDGETRVHELLKDAYVLFGVSALGLYDMRAFPFDTNTPGVEGHATALDNILSNDALRSATSIKLAWLPLTLLVCLGLLFALLFSRFEARPSLMIFVAFSVFFGALDVKVLFQHDLNIPTAFLFLEILMIFAVILAYRYYLEEKDKKMIKEAFSHYLAPAVVDMVLKDPTKLTTGGERKEISILFSDLKGFTTISESMEPKILAQFLNEYLTAMTDIVFEYEGTLDKYIGDAVMAFWGAPLHQKDHAYRACRAAVRMQERVHEIAADFKKRYNVEVGMRVGVNSGVVSVGNMGSKKIMEYTVIGDHVNLASRLEGLNGLYETEVLTTRGSIDLMSPEDRQKISYRVIDSVKVKGKAQAVEVVQLSRHKLHDSIIEIYTLAREEFKKRNWDEAEKLFKRSIELHQQHHGEGDTVSEAFLERLEAYRITPPDEKWDGAMEMRTK